VTRTLATIAVVLVAAGVAAALATRGDSRPKTLDQFSNRGRIVPTAGLLPIDRAELQHAQVAELRLLADRDGVRFYRGVAPGGSDCLVTARTVDGRERFSTFGCPSGFPSPAFPVADLTSYTQGLDDAYPVAEQVAGFAADDVGAVGVRSPEGSVRWIPVEANIYVDHPGTPAAELLVRDTQGNVVKRTPLGGHTLREEYGISD
jgi:hypothetical protein